MKIYNPIFIILLAAGTLFFQNLVLNPGFELHSVASGGYALFNSDVNNWHNPSNSTPDLYVPSLSVPSGVISDPLPHSGNAFAALLLIAGSTTPVPNWREYLQGELSTPLVANTEYCIEFYLNHRNNRLLRKID